MMHPTAPRPTSTVAAGDLAPGDTITHGHGVYAISWDTDQLVRITWTHREVHGGNRRQSLVRATSEFEVFI